MTSTCLIRLSRLSEPDGGCRGGNFSSGSIFVVMRMDVFTNSRRGREFTSRNINFERISIVDFKMGGYIDFSVLIFIIYSCPRCFYSLMKGVVFRGGAR